jgi:iron complex transport system substrate-binding protein
MAGRFLWIDALMSQGARRLAFSIAFILSAVNANAETTRPSRIVSINLCADELLVALADPEQIAALSPYATDPDLSYVAEQAAKFRHDAAEAEIVVDIGPDLVFAGRFTKLATRAMLTRLGYRIVLLEAARSIDQSIAQIHDIAEIVGHPERGAALIAEIESARRRAANVVAGSAPSAAIYQRRGYVAGAETLTGELLATVGLTNKGGSLAGQTGGFVPLERLVADGPDYLVVASPEADPEDQGTALLAHPALAAHYPPEKRIVLPEKLTVCAGPSLPAALDWLARETARIKADR